MLTSTSPVNMMGKGPKIWLSFLSFGFSIVATCTAATTSYEGFVVARLFLGALEAGILPSIAFTVHFLNCEPFYFHSATIN